MSDLKPHSPRRRKILPAIVLVVFFSGLVWHLLYEQAADRDWEAYKRAAELRGESMDWQRIVPIPPPAAQNFYGSAVAQKWMPRKQDVFDASAPHLPTNLPPPTIKMLKALPKTGGAQEMSLEKLHAWLEQWNGEFAEFRAAGKRKAVFLEGDYNSAPSIPIQDFVAARTLAQTIAAKAKVNLALGRPDAAALDMESLASVIRGMETRPQTLVAAMIRTAIATVYLDVAQEGLAEKAWGEEQLKTLQEYLDRLDLIGSTAGALQEGERVGISQLLDMVATGQLDKAGKATGSDAQSKMRDTFASFQPKGWVRRNQLFIASVFDEAAAALDVKGRRYHPRRAKDLLRRVAEETKGGKPSRMFAAMVIPNFGKAFDTAAKVQTMAMQASAACRLERHRLANGAYPEELAGPPRDLVTGEAMIYRKVGDGFLLYATGADGRDDGGDAKADWVW